MVSSHSLELAMQAGRVAEQRGWGDVTVVAADELLSLGPGGPPIVAVAEQPLTVEQARVIAGLTGAGRAVAVVSNHPIPNEAQAWLPPGVLPPAGSTAAEEPTPQGSGDSRTVKTLPDPTDDGRTGMMFTSLTGAGPGYHAVEDTPENRARDCCMRADFAAREGRWSEAEVLYREADHHGGTPGGQAAYALGLHATEVGNSRSALSWYERAREIGDARVRVMATVNAANAESRLGNPQRAIRLLEEVIGSSFPDQVAMARWGLAHLTTELGDWVSAEPMWLQFVELQDERGAMACYNVGQCRWMQDDLVGARQWFVRAANKGDPEVTAQARQSMSEL